MRLSFSLPLFLFSLLLQMDSVSSVSQFTGVLVHQPLRYLSLHYNPFACEPSGCILQVESGVSLTYGRQTYGRFAGLANARSFTLGRIRVR